MKDTIRHILSINLDDEFAYQRLLELFLNVKTFPVYNVPIVKEKSTIYRTRQNLYGDFTDFSDLSYPPSELIKDFGRVNKPFQSVFYGSDSFETTMTELMPNWFLGNSAGDIITLTTSSWVVQENLNVIIIPDFRNERMNEIIKIAKIREIHDEQLMFLGFINQIFSENSFYSKKIYKITSAYCNAIKLFFERENEKIDGILYTSAQDKRGWNLALESHVIDKELIKFKYAIKQFINKFDSTPSYNNFIEPQPPKSIDFKNKKINWN